MKRIYFVMLLCLTLFAVSPAQDIALADRDTVYYLSPVTVYPSRAFERESPVTFSNISGKDIEEHYSVQDVPVLLSELPSILFYSENGNGIGYNYINLRGFDQRRISVMINGVPQNDPEDHNIYWIDFPDLLSETEIIQVQRGAGSAFYGPPAIGGSINLVTNPFRQEPGITLETMLGIQEFGDSSTTFALNTRKYSLSVSSGLINNRYLIYGKLGRITSDGYRQHSWVNMNSYFMGAVRLDKTMTTRLHLFGGPFEDALVYFGLPKFVNEDKKLRRENLAEGWSVDPSSSSYEYKAQRRKQEIEQFSQPHYELLHEWRITPKITLYNTIFYYSGEGYYDYDASWADTSTLRIGFNYGIPTLQNPTNSLVRAYVGNKHGGWLPRIEFSHKKGEFIIGSELRLHRSTHWGKIAFAEGLPENFDPDYHFYEYNGEKDIASLFVHESYRPDSNITLMGSIQLVHNRYGIENEKYIGNTISVPYLFLNPRFGVNYNITNEWNSYVSIGYTSREPRLKNLYAAEYSPYGDTPQFRIDTTGGTIRYNFDEPLAKSEQLLDTELGIYYRTPSLHIGANIYWMEFTDELIKSGQVDIFGQPVTGNAERTRHMGLEVEAEAALTSVFTIKGNVSLSSNRLVKHRVFEDESGNDLTEPLHLDNNPIAGFPDILGNLRLTYRNDHLTVSLLGKYVGPFYTDNFRNNKNKNDDYSVFNGEILYILPTMLNTEVMLRGEVRNLFNTLYLMSGEGDAFFPAAERNYILGISVRI
jgi:iron complex outermembrane receptor protein